MKFLSMLGGGAAILLAAIAIATTSSSTAQTLTEAGQQRWYRGNLHTHSLWSDGDDYLESIADWYRRHGYQFLCFTDHNVLADHERWINIEKSKGGQQAFEHLQQVFPDWVESRESDNGTEVRLHTFDEVAERMDQPDEFLLIQGEEISDAFERKPIHINASNVQKLISPRHGTSVLETIQNNVDAINNQRAASGEPILVHLNHPNFGYAVTAEDIMRLQGEKFFEIYNGHPGVHNTGDDKHASTERIWDIVLAQRLGALELPVMYGLAVDDSHNYHNIPSRASEPGRGWVMVLTSELTPASLIAALEKGQFYASCGVELTKVESSPKGISLDVKERPGETFTIEFIGTRKSASLQGEPILDDQGEPLSTTYHYSPEIGEVFHSVQGTHGSYEFRGDELYVRARVTSSAEHPNPSEPGDPQRAWAQPVVGPAARR